MSKTMSSITDMPPVGLGLWKIEKTDTAATVVDAIKAGYRHLDSACDYGNEKQVGEGITEAIKQGLVTREELWVTSKLWNTYHAKEHVRPALERTLEDLGLDYLDLYLIHFPIALEYVPFEKNYPPEWLFNPEDDNPEMRPAKVPHHETWAAMEDVCEAGLVKNIGVCNYNSGLLHDLFSYARIAPAALQIESHPYLTQDRLIRLAKDLGMAVTAFSPLGALSYLQLGMADMSESVLVQDAVKTAAAAHGKTPAQIVLRWGIQRGNSIIPKSTKAERLRENLDIFDFELSHAEMDAIAALNQNRRFNDPGNFCEAAFGRFHPIYD